MATCIYGKLGNPANPDHAQYQHDRSPLNFVDRIVAALRERAVPVHYLILEGEGHGFSRNESMLAAYELTDRFLDRYSFGDGSVELS